VDPRVIRLPGPRKLALTLAAAAIATPAVSVAKAPATEGKLSIVAWQGYLDASWVKPFERQSRCEVDATYARSSNDMVALLRSGGGGRYDLGSVTSDVGLRLIRAGDVAPVDTSRVPGWTRFFTAFQSPPSTTVKGTHYGISLAWGPNALLYNAAKIEPAPTSWSVLYSPRLRGKITIPDNPLQIADAALYLSKIRPSLGIRDPYELTRTQFDATIALLRKQRPLVTRYWARASEEVDVFKSGRATVGAGWPYVRESLRNAKTPVEEIVPREGATGWLDSWMLSVKAKHPKCAYSWLAYVSSARVQALQAVTWGEAPVNRLACKQMDSLDHGSCAAYHANAPESFYSSIKFWKTPLAHCGNGRQECVDYSRWIKAWNEVIS
jgi:putative spermidine/putrescine transport system substrate-binding protein